VDIVRKRRGGNTVRRLRDTEICLAAHNYPVDCRTSQSPRNFSVKRLSSMCGRDRPPRTAPIRDERSLVRYATEASAAAAVAVFKAVGLKFGGQVRRRGPRAARLALF
jgi:hypothetical protein